MKKFTFVIVLLLTLKISAQVTINEITPDPGNKDGLGGEWIELYNSSGSSVDISCWKIWDGNFVVTIPNGTTLAAGDFYLIANSNFFNCSTCDYQNSTAIDLNLSTCGCTSSSMILDNSPGERVAIYNTSGTLIDAVQWAGGNNEGSTSITASIPSSPPSGCSSVSCTLPAPNDAAFELLPAAIKGCNSSYYRSPNGSNTWKTTNWPTPNLSNGSVDSFSFKLWNSVIKDSVYCGTASSTITLKAEIYNYQKINTTTLSNISNYPASWISSNNGITRTAWSTISGVGTGTTLLSSDVMPPLGVSTKYNLSIMEYIDNGCCGSSSPTSSQECYERKEVNLTRNITINTLTVGCIPGTGIIQATVAAGTGLTFKLRELTTNTIIATNTSGTFSGLTTSNTYRVIVSNGCSIDSANVDNTCRGTPPCPVINGATQTQINGSTGAISICANDSFNLRIKNGTNLPAGGTIDWYYSTTSGFNPYTTGTKFGSIPINGKVVINEFMFNTPGGNSNCAVPAVGGGHDGCSGVNGRTHGGEWIELFSNQPGKNIGCYTITTGNSTLRIPPNTYIPSDGFFVIGTSNVYHTNVDLFVNTTYAGSNIISGDWILGNSSGNGLIMFDQYNNLVAGNDIYYGSASAINGITAPNFGGQCPTFDPPSMTPTVSAGSISSTDSTTFYRTNDGVTTFAKSALGGYTMGTTNGGSPALSGADTSIKVNLPCLSPGTSTTYYVKAIVNPLASSCSQSDATGQQFSVTVTCPTVTLSGPANICPGGNDNLVLNFSPNGNYDVVYQIDNGNRITTNLTGNPANILISNPGYYNITKITQTSGAACSDSINIPAGVQVNSLKTKISTISFSCGNTNVQVGSEDEDPSLTYSVTSMTPSGTLPSSNNTGNFVFPNGTTAATFSISNGGCTHDSAISFGCALPVDWLYFNGQNHNSYHLLKWATASEINSDKFEIYRSANGKDYIKIGEVKAAGHSNIIKQYQFKAKNIDESKYYYYIKQIDFNGDYEFSKTISISNIADLSNWNIYPNPITNNGSIHVSSSSEYFNVSINLLSAQGQILKHLEANEYDANQTLELDINSLPKGMYYLQIWSDGIVKTQKVLIQ